jgi:hypothetical protein
MALDKRTYRMLVAEVNKRLTLFRQSLPPRLWAAWNAARKCRPPAGLFEDDALAYLKSEASGVAPTESEQYAARLQAEPLAVVGPILFGIFQSIEFEDRSEEEEIALRNEMNEALRNFLELLSSAE